MTIVRVADPLDPRLDDYRNLADAELARRRGLFIAEGRLVVDRLLTSPRYRMRSAMVTDTALAAMPALTRDLPERPVYVVPQDTMNGVTGFNIHRGCLAIGVRRPDDDIDGLLAHARRVVVLERVANADNVGGIFRAATALGCDGIVLDEVSTDPLYRKAIRTSMGASLQMPFARAVPLDGALAALRAGGFALIGLTPAPDAEPLSNVAERLRTRRVGLLLGHEGEGLTAAALAACDVKARIPMTGAIDSLNVATAAAIALHELRRAESVPPALR